MSNESQASKAGIAGWLGTALKVEPDEWRRLILAFFTFFLILACWFMLRPIREAAYANNAGLLHWLYLATFIVMLGAVPLFGYLVSRFPRRIFLPLIYLFFTACIAGFIALFDGENTNIWVQRAFTVWASVFNLFIVSLFWSFMVDVFRSSQGERLFGTILAGGSFGAILAPLIAGTLVERIGNEGVMALAMLVLIAATLMCIILNRYTRPQGRLGEVSDDRSLEGSIWEGAIGVFTSRYLLLICVFMLLHGMIAGYLHIGWSNLVDAEVIGFDARTKINAFRDMATNIIAFSLQFFITSRLLRHFGMAKTVVIPALVLATGLVLIGFMMSIPIFAAVLIAQRSMNYGIFGPVKEMLFTVVDRETKFKCKNFIDTVIYRGTDVIAGWSLKGLSYIGLSLSNIAFVLVPMAMIWLSIGWSLGKKFLEVKTELESPSNNHVSSALPASGGASG